MLRASLSDGQGIVLTPCGSVHSAMMRFPIDVIYLNDQSRVVKLAPWLRPYRVSIGGRHAHAVIELPAGALTSNGAEVGDLIALADDIGAPVTV
jgi:uncharacterized membrane protein (UPF0127 family)